MFLLNLSLYNAERINVNNLIKKVKPYLKHGSIILSSNFNIVVSYISPTSIKHCSFCYIIGDNYHIIEISETGFRKTSLYDFIKSKTTIFILEYIDEKIMNQTMDYIFKYKDKKYGFLDDQEYCYKLLFNLYNEVYNFKYKKISDFIPAFKILDKEYINSNSLISSKKFYPKCCIINNYFIKIKE